MCAVASTGGNSQAVMVMVQCTITWAPWYVADQTRFVRGWHATSPPATSLGWHGDLENLLIWMPEMCNLCNPSVERTESVKEERDCLGGRSGRERGA